MPLLAPLLVLVQLQELAPLAQAQLQVRTLHLRVPRLRFELLQAMVARLAFAPLANVLGAQPSHISLPDKLPCMGGTRKDECDIVCVACKLGLWSGLLWPTHWSHFRSWSPSSKHDAIGIHNILRLGFVRTLSGSHHSGSLECASSLITATAGHWIVRHWIVRLQPRLWIAIMTTDCARNSGWGQMAPATPAGATSSLWLGPNGNVWSQYVRYNIT